jgi:hypothetical protein
MLRHQDLSIDEGSSQEEDLDEEETANEEEEGQEELHEAVEVSNALLRGYEKRKQVMHQIWRDQD